MRCLWCKKDSGRNKYCCVKCNVRDYYQKHRDMRIIKAKEWNLKNKEKRIISSKKSLIKFRKENPERVREHSRMQYKKNKTSAGCRSKTWGIIKSEIIKINEECKNCGKKTNIEIHHEEYPISKNDIMKAIVDGRIYYLCKKCHGNYHSIKRKVL